MTTTRRHFASTILFVIVAWSMLFTGHATELSAYVAPDQPGCVTAPYAGPGSDQGYYCDQYEVDMSGASDPVAECLIAQGYHGRPDDNAEIIYSTSDAIDRCAA